MGCPAGMADADVPYDILVRIYFFLKIAYLAFCFAQPEARSIKKGDPSTVIPSVFQTLKSF
jgi:hypothetical protein